MKIQNNTNKISSPNHKGSLDGVITGTLRTLNTNPMANAVGIDLFSMVVPRTYVDTKERNKYAGAETFFREFTGTLIVCLSASYIAKALSKIANRFVKPQIPINTGSWYSKDSLNFLDGIKADDTKSYISKAFESLSGHDGDKTNKFSDIDWKSIEWNDEKRWSKINWDDKKYRNIHLKLQDKESIISAAAALVEDKTVTGKDKKNLLTILGSRLTNALGAEKVTAQNGSAKTSAAMSEFLRDTVDYGKDILNRSSKNDIISKISKINKIKAAGAVSIASVLGLTNQYINRKITEKRTGKQGFVGEKNYTSQMKDKKNSKDNSITFKAEKILASAGMIAMAAGVMKVKSLKDFAKKLEFTGPVTSGNTIKTVYASTLIGRFLASDNKNELRESVTRDYLGFLNWLVLGGFASKAAANILDPKRKNIFNEAGGVNVRGDMPPKQSKMSGLKYWLNNLSLKTHNEIAAKGSKFAKKNMWKLNLAQTAGLIYSTTALGILLPKLNIFITNRKNEQNKAAAKHASSSKPDIKFGSLQQFKDLNKKQNP